MRARRSIVAALAALALALPACDYLRDAEPFTVTITYTDGLAGGVVVEPIRFEADAAFGEVQIVNQTQIRRGFAIPELAVFLEVPAKLQGIARVQEAKDGRTYRFYDHIDGHENDFSGEMVVHYLSEEER